MIESFSEGLGVGDAEGVNVGEAVVPSGALDLAQRHHALHRLQDHAPQLVELYAARLQRHDSRDDNDHNDDKDNDEGNNDDDDNDEDDNDEETDDEGDAVGPRVSEEAEERVLLRATLAVGSVIDKRSGRKTMAQI